MCVCLLVKTTLRCVGTWNVEGHIVVSLSRQVDAGLLGMLSDLVQNTAHSSTLSATIFSPFHFLWKFRGKPRLTRQGNRSECWIELGLHLQLDGDCCYVCGWGRKGGDVIAPLYEVHWLYVVFFVPFLPWQDLVKEERLPFRGVNSIVVIVCNSL